MLEDSVEPNFQFPNGTRIFEKHLSNEKNPGWLGYILPSYIGIITHHYKDPY